MNNYLWVGEKWCDANPRMGWTNSFHNFYNTLCAACPTDNFNTLHLDEASIIYGRDINEVLIEYCQNYPVDVIFFTLVGNSPLNPSLETFKKLKEMGKFTCFFWHDSGPGYGIETIKSFGDTVGLNVSIDYPVGPHINNYQPLKNHIFLWTPQDENLYRKGEKKDIPISFVGTKKYPDRNYYLGLIQQNFPQIYISGGQRETRLNPEEYAKIFRRSRISLNFSLSETRVFYQLKGRPFECTASGTLLIESKNPSTSAFFEPGKEYIEFDGPEDLIGKITHYLNIPEETDKIAENGHQKYKKHYNSKIFWNKVFASIEKQREP